MGKERDDFFWTISGSEQLRFDVFDTLEKASVDARERRILWPDGTRLSIEDAARRIHAELATPLDTVQFHVVSWLQMDYEPEGLDDDQMEEFERLIEQWTAPYENAR